MVRWLSEPFVAAAASAAPSCQGEDRGVARPLPARGVQTQQWEIPAPADGTTFDLSGVTSTAYPATRSVFEVARTSRPSGPA